MGIKHKHQTPVADGEADGRVQPSYWNEDHDAGPVVDALVTCAPAPKSLLYLDADGKAQALALSDFVRGMLAANDGAATALALGVAPLLNPDFSGNVFVPTIVDTSDNTRRAASTAFVQAVRALLAPKDSPTLTGIPLAPTAVAGANNTQIANTAFVAAALAALVNSSPATLDTLKELADAIGSDPNFAATMAAALGNRLRFDAAQALSAGAKAQLSANGGLPRIIKIRRITATGTYVPDANLIFARAIAQGAGGGGGGCALAPASSVLSGGGGGSGSSAVKILTPADIGAGLAITIGAAGAAGAAGANNGGNGGDTSIASLCIGKGGGGGPGSDGRAGGAGGVAGTGDSIRLGRNGMPGCNVQSSNSGANGADSNFGTGGRCVNLNGPGGAATGYGSGGAGGINFNSGGASVGGAGAPGYVEIEEYCSA